MPLFWTSGDVSSGFQSQSGQPYSYLTKVFTLIFTFVLTVNFRTMGIVFQFTL